MTKAQQMLAKAGFPDTAAGRAAFHKQYPTPDSFFQVHGGSDTEMYKAGSTIHIDPSKVGTFTAAATEHGKSVQGFASQVLANKENYSPAMVKKANFARNAASWKHQDGGKVMYKDGSKVNNPPLTPEELKWLATSLRGIESAKYLSGQYPDNTIPGGHEERIKKLDPLQLEQLKNYMSNTDIATDFMQLITPNIEFFNPKPVKSKLANGGLVMYGPGGSLDGGEDPFAPGKAYLQGWQDSPMFKQIIRNQAESMYPSNPRRAEGYYNQNTQPMFMPQGKSLMGVSAKNNDPNLYVRYFPKDVIGIEKSLMDRDAALGNNLFTRAATLQYNPATSVDFELINNTPARVVKGEENEYEYGDPLKASIHGLRQAGQASGIYNPYTQPFKKEYIDQYNEFYKTNPTKNPLNNLLKFYTPEQVEYFMNNISQNKGQSGENMQMAALGSFVEGPPEDEYSYLKGSMSAPYDRFPKKDPGFNNGPGTYWYYMDRLKNQKVNYATPHKGVKDAEINMHTITGPCESGTCYEFKKDGGLVDAYQLMGMPTPHMYGPGSRVETNFHPSLNLSTAINPVAVQGKGYDVNYQNAVSNSIAGSIPLFRTGPNQAFKLAGDYTYTNNPSNINSTGIPSLGLEWAGGDVPGEGSNRWTPSRRFDNSNIAHRGNHGNLGGFAKGRIGIAKVGEGYIPYTGVEAGTNIGIGRLPRSGGLPKGTAYLKLSGNSVIGGPLNQVDKSYYSDPNSPIHSYENASDRLNASIGGTYNFNKNLSAYGEAGLRSGTNNSPRFEFGLSKTFADGGHVTNYSPSSDLSAVRSMNNTYMHGYGNGGPVGMYKTGSFFNKLGNTWKNSMLLGADALTSVINTDIIGDDLYSGNTFFGNSPATFTDASHYIGENVNSIAPVAANFILPGSGLVIGGLQAAANPFIKDDQTRMQSKSGRNAALMGLGLDIAGAIASAGTNMAGAGKSAAEVAKTAPKIMKTVADASKAVQAAGVVSDAYNTAKDPNADWKDWTRVGLNAVGTVGGNMASSGTEGMANVQNPFGSMQGIKDLNKYSQIASVGNTLGNAAKAGKAGMSLYNTGENIDRYGLNSQTTMQGINAVGQGLGAASNFSENPNFKDFANTYNALGSAANLGMDLYNTIDSGSKDTLDYARLAPQGLNAGMQINNMFSNQRPGQFVPSSLMQMSAMGGAVNAPNMMQYGSGGSIGYNDLDLTELSKQNNLMDNSRLLGYNLIGTDKFDAGSYVNSKPTSMKEDYEMFRTAKPVTKYYSNAMPAHPADGSMDPRGTVTGAIDPQTGEPVEINVEGNEAKWKLRGKHNLKAIQDFISRKKDTKKAIAMYENGDTDGLATLLWNTKFDKDKKEAKEQAQQQAIQQARQNAAAQLEAMQMQAAKYGGMVNTYGYGGGVKMYDGGAGIYYPTTIAAPISGQALPASISPTGMPMFIDPQGGDAYTYSYMPNKGWVTYKAGSNKGIPLYGNPKFQSTIDALNNAYGASGQGYPVDDMTPFTPPIIDESVVEMPPGSDVVIEQDPFLADKIVPAPDDRNVGGLSGITRYRKVRKGKAGTPPKSKEEKDSNLQDTLITAGALTPALTNLGALLFGKTPNYTAPQIPLLQWVNRSSEAQKRAIKQAYASAKYKLPTGSAHGAERTALAAAYMNALGNIEEQTANANAMGYMDTAGKNAGITGQNIANYLAAENAKAQAQAARLNIGTTVGTQIGQLAEAARMKKFYEKLYPTFSGGKYMINSKGDIVPIISTSTEDKDNEGK